MKRRGFLKSIAGAVGLGALQVANAGPKVVVRNDTDKTVDYGVLLSRGAVTPSEHRELSRNGFYYGRHATLTVGGQCLAVSGFAINNGAGELMLPWHGKMPPISELCGGVLTLEIPDTIHWRYVKLGSVSFNANRDGFVESATASFVFTGPTGPAA